MITRGQYLEALEMIDNYHRQGEVTSLSDKDYNYPDKALKAIKKELVKRVNRLLPLSGLPTTKAHINPYIDSSSGLFIKDHVRLYDGIIDSERTNKQDNATERTTG
jgi:hypothetical protein